MYSKNKGMNLQNLLLCTLLIARADRLKVNVTYIYEKVD